MLGRVIALFVFGLAVAVPAPVPDAVVVIDPHAHLRDPWRTYAQIADAIVCPEYDRLSRVRGIDGERLSRTLRDCQEAVARDNPDLFARLQRASTLPVKIAEHPRRETGILQGWARTQASIERLRPARSDGVFLVNDARRLARDGEDAAAALRIATIGRIAMQIAAGATAIHIMNADAAHHTALYAVRDLLVEERIGPASARATLEMRAAHRAAMPAILPRMIACESGAALAQVRFTTRQYIPFLLSIRHPLPFDRPQQVDHRFWIAATFSWLRVWCDPPHAIRHEALLRALGAWSIGSTYLRNMWRYRAEFDDQFGETLDALREIAEEG